MIKNVYKDLLKDLDEAFLHCDYDTTAHYKAGIVAGKAALAAELKLISLDQYLAFNDKIDDSLRKWCNEHFKEAQET